MSKSRLVGRLLRTTMLTGCAAAIAMPAFAQDQAASGDEIVVTGSRIATDQLSAPSPVTVTTSEQLKMVNTVNSEQFLNSLPQFIPAFDSSSNNPGDGSATVDLRGLGAVRTLVLVDGARFASRGADAVVDINNIPSALVDRIEVVTGGASAIYGSDAVAGVVNFILKKDFEGVQLDVSDQFTGQGDGNIFNTALTIGGNFADGRGNAVLSASYTNRESLFQADRAFSTLSFFDPGPGGTEFIPGGSSNIPGTRLRGATDSNFNIDPNTVDARCATNSCSGFFIDEQGDLRGLRFGTQADPVTDLYNYAPTNYLQLPQERYNIAGFATYDINDHMQVYARGIFASTTVDSQLAPTPAGVTLTINLDNPFLSQELHDLIANDPDSNNGDGTATVRTSRRYQELGTRNSLRETNSFQTVIGLKGDLNDTWSYDTFFNFSRSTVSQSQTGNLSISALKAGVLCDGGPTAIASGCTAPAVNIFGGPGSISDAGAAFINRTGIQLDTIEQTQIVSSVSGDLGAMKSPFAQSPIGVAFGVEYRENSAVSQPDSVLGPDVAGFNSSLPVKGRFDVYEAFMETEIPVIEGAPLIDSFSINGAYRYSDYSIKNVGSTHTFAVGGDWQLVPDFRIRTQFARAVRAPNVSELFSAFTNGFPGASDPCSSGNGSFDSGVDVQSCIDNGVPAAAVGTAFQSNGQIEGLFGGNPDLGEETADTLTIGGVWTPSFIDGLTAQIDYYKITVDNAIRTLPLQVLLDDCHRNGVQAACNIITRNPATGEIADPFRPNLGALNIATLRVKGIDFNVNYRFDADQVGMPASAGSFYLQYNGSYTLENGFQSSPSQAFIDCTGTYGLTCNEPTPTYKHTAQFGWIYGPFTTQLRWRYIGAVDADASTLPLSDLSDNISAKSYLDLTLSWEATQNVSMSAGVRNITGTDVPVLGSTASEQGNTWPATYETLGRQIFLGATLKF